MKLRKIGIWALSGAIFWAASPMVALAGDGPASGPASGLASDEPESRVDRPLLSRFLSTGNSSDGTLLTSPARPSRFSLGFFTAGGDELSVKYPLLNNQPLGAVSHQSTVAALESDNYYGAARLDVTSLNQASGYDPEWARLRDEQVSLSLEAGVGRDELSAGLLYAYQNTYSPLTGQSPTASYPMYFFTPTGDGHGAIDGASIDNHAVFLYLGYNLSRQLNLRGTMGLAQTGAGGDDHALRIGESSRRWGVDIGATYRLLDNLVYEAHLGYVSIDEPTSSRLNDDSSAVPHASGAAPDSLYQIGSQIRMTF